MVGRRFVGANVIGTRLASPRVLPYTPKRHLAELASPPGSRHYSCGLFGLAGTVAGPGVRDGLLALVEAVLFVADEPVTAKRIAEVVGLRDASEARRAVRRLQSLLEADGSPFTVQAIAGGFQLTTQPEYRPWLVRLRTTGFDWNLSAAAQETLAIIAYRQPITRAEIEAIRGVQCADVLRVLIERGWVRIVGRQNTLGRPVLYGTTRQFLRVLGLDRLQDLPPIPMGQLAAKASRPDSTTASRQT
ncbi:MAG: SMC-Scp complex subunit ScpB [Gemmatales bacterium]|nr:SMC-Scp complex subunit ScpB [Gemmatales bacterium]MDW7994667.1 SMC-Scp complex subunit ScpB [Gemmatales bacterium]